MNELLDAVATALDAVRRLGARPLESLNPAELMALNAAFGVLKRRTDAAYLPVAAEITRQSRPELGKDSLAKKQGYRTPATLISATTGTSTGEAARIMAVGEATAPRMTLDGESRPAKHPHVADALTAGSLGMPAASAIITMLDRVVMRADRVAAGEMERRLVERAPGLTLEQLQKLIQRAEAFLDPDGVARREEELRDERFLTIREDRFGAILLSGKFDPESGARIKVAVEGLVTGMLQHRDQKTKDGKEAGQAMEDTRSVKQMQADALTFLATHSLGCDEIPTRPTTTLVLRMTLAELEAGLGHGTIDGINQPVSAGTVRRMAADAQVIPCVLGGDSEILDWGRARRLFSVAQKLASGERDGGCAGCGLPASMTIMHHIEWWWRDHGPTDLANGVLLCVGCHHRVHDEGWDIRVEGVGLNAKVWFTPPVSVDPSRTPRLGGKARYDLTA
jgi:hypothetical protein